MVPVSYLTLRTHGPIVVRLIATAFGRNPDPTGLNAMAGALEAGATVANLVESLVDSQEFIALHGSGTDADPEFVRRVLGFMQTVMRVGRPGADDTCRDIMQAVPAGATRAETILALSQSPAARSIPLFPGLAPESAPDDATAYRLWVETYDTPSPEDLAGIRQAQGTGLLSVIMTCGDSTVPAVCRSLDSLCRQTDHRWELCLVAGLRSSWPRQELSRLAASEPRLRVIDAKPAGANRAAPLRAGLEASCGGLLCFLDAGDELAASALTEVQAGFSANPDAMLLYTDEDRISGGHRSAPRFKAAYSADAMLAGNAIGQLAVFRRALVEQVGTWPVGSSPVFAFTARAAGLAGPARIHHLAAVLCHRADAPPDWPAAATQAGDWPHPPPNLPEPPPLVSIIVLTRDHAALLAACSEGVLNRTGYPAIELLVIDNGSTEPAALDLLARLEQRPGVRVLRRPGAFNFAALNNDAARHAKGSVVVLLNNDIEVLQPDWLGEMVGHVLQPDVGAVGARLLYPDGSLQHGGILLGPAGEATHVARGSPRDAIGYDGHLAYAHDFSAVTGACLAMRREVFAAVGGMNEDLAVTWNDIDLCLRVRAAGLRVVWTPHAVLMHREGSTRGLEDTDPAKYARFRAEQALVGDLWPEAMRRDPFLNANLVTQGDGLRLAAPRLARSWHASRTAA